MELAELRLRIQRRLIVNNYVFLFSHVIDGGFTGPKMRFCCRTGADGYQFIKLTIESDGLCRIYAGPIVTLAPCEKLHLLPEMKTDYRGHADVDDPDFLADLPALVREAVLSS